MNNLNAGISIINHYDAVIFLFNRGTISHHILMEIHRGPVLKFIMAELRNAISLRDSWVIPTVLAPCTTAIYLRPDFDIGVTRISGAVPFKATNLHRYTNDAVFVKIHGSGAELELSSTHPAIIVNDLNDI